MSMSAGLLRRGPLVVAVLAAAAALLAVALTSRGASAAGPPALRPLMSGYQQISASTTPPTEAQCFSAGRRCFTPQGIRAAYDVNPLYASGFTGKGHTIAVVDSYGSDTIAHDLHVYDSAFGIQPMCGEEGVKCKADMPRFSRLALQGTP